MLISGDYWVGSLAGYNDGSITTSSSSGSVSGRSSVGGLVGTNNRGSITTSSSSSRVSGRNRVGGLVGENGGSITTSSSSSRVSGRDRVGGLVGQNHGSITKCHNTGSVSGVEDVGGLVGRNYSGGLNSGQIAASYNSGSVSGNNFFGGLVGTDDKGGIATSYSSGSVSGTSYVGGLVGTNNGSSIATSYSSGSVRGSEGVGGLVGIGSRSSPARVMHSVWDTETSGLSESIGGVGLTTAEMMDLDMLSLNGFANDPNWVLDGGRDYPRLAWEGTPGSTIPDPRIDWLDGDGTAENPYRIDTADQLILLGRASILWDRHFILGADIDLDPARPGHGIFRQAVLPVFSGVFDGGGHVISNLTIEGGSYLGLFGILSSGDIKNVAVVDVNIIGSGSYVGGLAGESSGSIATSYSSGSVRGSEGVGGLVGLNDGGVTACHSAGTVAGEFCVGGLLGGNSSSLLVRQRRAVSVSRCYSSSSVSGECYVGGLLGSASAWGFFSDGGVLKDCYATGRVLGTQSVGGLVGEMDGDVVGCFWDTQTSGQTEVWSYKGTGKTTAEMQTAQTFLDAGWDFVGETANGTDDIWWILEGQDYPRLWWELPSEH